MSRLALALLATLTLGFTAATHADTPGVYAIRGARVVPVTGPVLESGTVILRNGLIDGVGPSLSIPSDAVIVEGSGLTVYPGLIDLGSFAATEQLAIPPLQNARTMEQVERWKRDQILRPHALAADAVRADEAQLTRLAAAGITSVLALPGGDVISGQSALVNLAASPDTPQVGAVAAPRRNLFVVKSPVALHVSFPARPRAGSNAYPISLMGVIAFVHQAFLDAQYYGLQLERGPAPPENAEFAAMQPALRRQIPVAFEASEQREILRALKLARELNLDPIITGAHESNQVIADLKQLNARVIFSLAFPQRLRSLAPDADEPLRTLEARLNVAKAPADLSRAGVLFGFSSAGVADPKDFLKNAARTVREGLGSAAAIRALTLDAATIAGAGNLLGAIEKGRIANLLMTDGDLFAETTRIVRVWVEGRPVPLGTPPSLPDARRSRAR